MKKWRCKVCGYVHEGDAPPDECPICGVGPDEFEVVAGKPSSEAVHTPVASKRWKCTICDYIHAGDRPPDVCPICGVGPEKFVSLADETSPLTEEMIANASMEHVFAALDKVSYGLYVVSSFDGEKLNGQCSNTVFQLTHSPAQIAVCLNKQTLTHQFVNKTGYFAVSILGQDHLGQVKHFGYKSGRVVDKFAEVEYIKGKNGCPIIKQCISYLECKVIHEKTTDVGTHTLFIAEVTSGGVTSAMKPLTYELYRQSK